MEFGNEGTLLVEIDEELQSIVPAFLESRMADCRLIETMLSIGNMEEIKSRGHRIKGAGGSYGFDEISEIGELLEDGAIKADIQLVKTAVERLESYLKRVTVKYV